MSLPRSLWLAAAAVTAAAATACGGDGGASGERAPGRADATQEELLAAIEADVRPYTRRHAETFAGLWLGRGAHDGKVVVAFTAGVDRHRRALRERFRYGDRLRVVQRRRSVRELDALRDRIFAQRDALKVRHGFTITTGGLDLVENQVGIGMRDPSRRAERILRERFGPAVDVRPEPERPVLRGGGGA